jgi:hypothetical protein
MPGRSKLECDLHELLDEANSLLLAATLDVRHTATLIGKLRNCADQARDAGLADAAARLRKAAEDLERRLMSP